MGAKFAPSLANLFMAKWEEDVVYVHETRSLVLWTRYIDDILLLWNGTMETLDEFFECLNNNDRGIALSYQASKTKIHFLDLQIEIINNEFRFSTYFKSTDRNGFIPVDSCHHVSWLNSVPRSQFLRLRRNCTEKETFFEQAKILKSRFEDKGYNTDDLNLEIQKAVSIDRKSLLEVKPKKESDGRFRWALLTSFSTQHRQIKNIMRKHWGVLKQDSILGPLIPEGANVIFRGVPSLKGQIAPNIINPPTRPLFFHDWTGFFPCRKCTVCQHNNIRTRKVSEFASTVTGRRYTIKPFCTCSTRFVVYLITCPCLKQYIGRTTRTFSIRVGEHIALIKSRDPKHTVPRHYKEFHGGNPEGSQFVIIDKYTPPWRGGARTRGVSRLEMFWAYELKTFAPSGLNVEVDVNAFLDES